MVLLERRGVVGGGGGGGGADVGGDGSGDDDDYGFVGVRERTGRLGEDVAANRITNYNIITRYIL